MNHEQVLAEIREANLTYLMLAQTLIRQDKAEAVFRLGLNEEAADLLASLSPSQVMKIASRNTLLCSFRVDDPLVWGLLTNQYLARQHPDGQPRLRSALSTRPFAPYPTCPRPP